MTTPYRATTLARLRQRRAAASATAPLAGLLRIGGAVSVVTDARRLRASLGLYHVIWLIAEYAAPTPGFATQNEQLPTITGSEEASN